MAGLVAVEHDIKPVRLQLWSERARASRLAGFDELIALHRKAGELVARIMSSDAATMEGLREAELARRFAAQTIETGEATLAAYRKVISPPLPSAALFGRRG
jgi:hypothetical protein